MNVSKGTHRSRDAENAFIDGAGKLGYQEFDDLQNLDNNNGVERYQKYIGPSKQTSARSQLFAAYADHTQHRQMDAVRMPLIDTSTQNSRVESVSISTALAERMLTLLPDPNLHALVEKQVIRVLLEDKKAIGVEYQSNPRFLANPEFLHAGYTSPRSVRARKLVVCSAGANGTPLILERSGIGSAEILKKAGVEVVEDLPGVGNDYQDHHLSLWSYRTSFKPRECINGFADGRFDIAKAIHENDELLGTNAMDGRK